MSTNDKLYPIITVYDDISGARQIIEKRTPKKLSFGTFCPIYTFSNENISCTYRLTDFHNKDVLTVCSSGDHALSAILCGANKVDTFDINRLTKYFADLKRAAIITLSYDEFFDFLGDNDFYNDKTILDEKTYLKLCPLLDKDSVIFWDSMYNLYSKDGHLNAKNLFLQVPVPFYRSRNNAIPFLSKERFLVLKRYLLKKSFSFIESNLQNINKNTESTYDIIHLSNTVSYSNIDSYKDFIEKNIDPMLKPDGLAFIDYLFAYLPDYDYPHTIFDNKEDYEKEEKNKQFIKKQFIQNKTVYEQGTVIYKKNKAE